MKARIVILTLVIFGIVFLFFGLYGLLQTPDPASPVKVPQPTHTQVPVDPVTEVVNEPVETEPVVTRTAEPEVVPTAVATEIPSQVFLPTGNPEVFKPLEPEEMERITRRYTPPPVYTSVFKGKVFVGLYGAPSGPGLGILGRTNATNTVAIAVEQALAYQALLTDSVVIPFFHMVTTVADPFAGPDGNYNHRMTTDTVQIWIDVAHQFGLASVVDIQTGYSPITTELEYHRYFLEQKDVHLAIDPEFMMPGTGAVPGDKIGHMSAKQLNIAQAWLNKLAMRIGEQKALIIHQFDPRMFSGKEEIIDYPRVDLVWDSDGFGGPGAKKGDYLLYATEPGFEYGGFKLFYNYDTPLMSPAEVLELDPKPVFVVYQ